MKISRGGLAALYSRIFKTENHRAGRRRAPDQQTLKTGAGEGLQDAGVDVLVIGMSGTEEICARHTSTSAWTAVK